MIFLFIYHLLSKEQQFAEKLHAYTLPRSDRQNSRVKDLVDLILLLQRGNLEYKRVEESLVKVFSKRKTHELPPSIESPPDDWKPVFEKLAKESNVNVGIERAYILLKDFFANLNDKP